MTMNTDTITAAMDAIAPDPFLETQVFAHFAPHYFLHGKTIEVDGREYRVAIRPGNLKMLEIDDNQYGADGFIEINGAKLGIVDPERKTKWPGGEWPPNWSVNVAVHPRKQFAAGIFVEGSRTKKLQYLRLCAMRGYPGFIALYSNAFGDQDKPSAIPNINGIRSVLLVPASALYSQDGIERLPVVTQGNSYSSNALPVFKVPIAECFLVSSPQEFEDVVFSSIPSLIRSLKNED